MPTVLKSGNLNLLEPSGPFQGCKEIALPFTPIIFLYVYFISCNGAVDTVIIAWAIQQKDCGSILEEEKDLSLLQSAETSPRYWKSHFFPGVERPGHEAPHSLSFVAEVKDKWSNTSAHLYILVSPYLYRYFTLYIYIYIHTHTHTHTHTRVGILILATLL